MNLSALQLGDILRMIGIVLVSGLALCALLAVWVFYKVRRIVLPINADFFETLRATPLSVVILLDLLDLTLDFFSAPFAWLILGKLGLEPLRTVTIIESLIPGTELLPTMTIAWVIARMWKNAPRIPDLKSIRQLIPIK